jgi:hypothetical protein
MQVVRVSVSLAAVLTVATLISCSSSAGGNSVVPQYAMGERAQAGAVIYTVFEKRWMAQLGAGESARIPKNRFLLLRLSMVNSGSGEAMAPSMTLIDDNGQRFPELSDGDGVPQWTGFIRRIKPADTMTGNVVFDVPASHYKLELTDESEEKKALVDIPLSFEQDQVPVPAPGAPDSTQQRPNSPR